jgi:O-acetyl-ADP-ribose deacetylase (regulator of RNase III)
MLRFVTGNLFDSKAQTLVNTVNCVGVMGKGVALAFKERFPAMFEHYRALCERGEIQPGVLTLYTDTVPWVINFPTKRHWRGRSRLDDIEAGLITLARRYKEWGVESVAMPALGCGHGGLNWSEVRPLIERHLGSMDLDIEVYEPTPAKTKGTLPQAPESSTAKEAREPVDLFGQPIPTGPAKRRRKKK